MTSHKQNEWGQTLPGCSMLILEEPPIPTRQERGAEPGAALSKALTCPARGDSIPFSPPASIPPNARFPLCPGSPSQSSILQPATPFQLHPPHAPPQAGQAGGADPGSLPESPAPHHRAERVSLPYMKEGSPRADAPWAAQTLAAQQGAACVPEEAAALARPCLAFIGNEDEGFGSGLRGSP